MKKNIFKILMILTICFSINVVKAIESKIYPVDCENYSCKYVGTAGGDAILRYNNGLYTLDYAGNKYTFNEIYTPDNLKESDGKYHCEKKISPTQTWSCKDDEVHGYQCPSNLVMSFDTNGKPFIIADNYGFTRDGSLSENLNDNSYCTVIGEAHEGAGGTYDVESEKKQTSKRKAAVEAKKTCASVDCNKFYDTTIKYRKCGSLDHIPMNLPVFSNALYRIIKFLVPIVLILMGVIDFAQAVMGKDDNEMEQKKNKFIKRLIAAVLVFFTLSLVQFIVNLTGSADEGTSSCVDCFINSANRCETYTYQQGGK